MQIQPLGKNLLLEPQTGDTKTQSGLIMPESEEGEQPLKGTLIGVGEESSPALQQHIGKTILYGRYSGNKIGGFVLLADTDALGVVIQE